MSSYPRDEVERAFHEFLRRGAYGHDWVGWSEVFTDDALYTEHCLGHFVGSTGIREWIVAQMAMIPSMSFSIEWYDIVDDKVSLWIWNHLPDPSGGSEQYEFPNYTLLTYAGDGKWRKEEDVYDPATSESTVVSWFKAGGNQKTPDDRSLRPKMLSHPPLPRTAPTKELMQTVISSIVPTGAHVRECVVNGSRAAVVYDTTERTYGLVLHVDGDGKVVFKDEFTNSRENFEKKEVLR
ncbi:MAG: hypothetical protein RLZ84_218 [Actinomycetota bacterium]